MHGCRQSGSTRRFHRLRCVLAAVLGQNGAATQSQSRNHLHQDRGRFSKPAARQADEAIRQSLEALRDARGCDTAFIAHVAADGLTINRIQVVRSSFAQCQPEGLKGENIGNFPWWSARLEHLRLAEFRDTSAPRPEQRVEAQRLAETADCRAR